MVAEVSSEHRQVAVTAPVFYCAPLASSGLKMLVDPDLSLKDSQVPSLTAHETDFRVRGRREASPILCSSTLVGPPGFPTPQTPILPCPSPPHLAVVFSLSSDPLRGRPFFVESAILISHRELLGFFSLVREGGGEAET